MRNKKYISLVFIAFLLTGCTSVGEKQLRSLVYYDGCTSACWVGIEVGITNFDEAQRILDDRYTHQNTELLPVVNIILWRTNEVDSSYGTVTFSQDIVSDVQLFLEKSKFIASDTIKVFGEPSDVMISIDPTKPRKCGGIQLSYSETGTMVYLDTTQAFKGVEKSQFVTGFWFRSPEDLKSMHSNIQSDGISMVVEWQGYKDYCEVIPQ